LDLFAHFTPVANLATLQPTDGMQLGTMHYFAAGDCNPGPHLHVEMSDNKDGGRTRAGPTTASPA
jgi:hypothetical protein